MRFTVPFLALVLLLSTFAFYGISGTPVSSSGQISMQGHFQSRSPGFVYETLALNNHTLLHGNYIRDYEGEGPWAIFYDNFSGDVYVSYSNSGNLSVFNGTTLQFIENISLNGTSFEFQTDPKSGDLLVYSTNGSGIYFIDPSNVITRYNPSLSAIRIAVDPNLDFLYLMEWDGSVEIVYEPNLEPIKTLNLFGADIVYNPLNGEVYVLNINGTNSNLLIIDGLTVVNTVGLGPFGIEMKLDLTSNVLIVTGDGAISEYNASTGQEIRSIGIQFYGIGFSTLYCSGNGYLYAISHTIGQVRVFDLNGNYITGMNVGPWPSPTSEGSAYDGAISSVLLVNRGSDTMTIIPLTIYEVQFNENYLETGTDWGVTIGNLTEESNGSSIAFILPNGTYHYRITYPSTYTLYNPEGNLTVNGNVIIENLNFNSSLNLSLIRIYSVGLPLGQKWTVRIGNISLSQYNTALAGNFYYEYIAFYIQNGIYNYSISSPGYRVVSPYATDWEWSIYSNPFQPDFPQLTNLSSTGTINTFNSSQFAAYFKIAKYDVIFSENGLANGTYWSIDLNGNVQGTNGENITYSLPNGTYSFNISTMGTISPSFSAYYGVNGYNASISGGTININSTGEKMIVNFTRNLSMRYANFTFINYPTDYLKIIQIGNISEYTVFGQNISFLLKRGEYTGRIMSPFENNMLYPWLGGIYVREYATDVNFSLQNNYSTSVAIKIPKGYYLTTFRTNETPHMSSPFIWIGKGNNFTGMFLSQNSTVYAYLTNGTYQFLSLLIYSNFTFSLSPISSPYFYGWYGGYIAKTFPRYLPSNGTFSVSGQNSTVFLNFEKEYLVTVRVNGISQGQGFTLIFNGQKFESTNGSVTLLEPNGTYNYTIKINGVGDHYVLENGSGSISVNGSDYALEVDEIPLHEVTFDITGSVRFPVTIVVNGIEYNATGTLSLYLRDGTYNYRIITVPGLKAVNGSGTFTVNNASVILTIAIEKSSPPQNYNSLYLVTGSVLVLLAVVAGWEAERRRTKKK